MSVLFDIYRKNPVKERGVFILVAIGWRNGIFQLSESQLTVNINPKCGGEKDNPDKEHNLVGKHQINLE